MDSHKSNSLAEAKRKKRELVIVCILLISIPIILYFASRSLRWNIELSVRHKVLVFSLININVILLLLLLYLILRNLVKLFIQRRRGIVGSHIRSKLVVSFVILSLFPTMVLFFASVQYISASVDYWFGKQIDKAISDATQMSIDFKNLIIKSFKAEIDNVFTPDYLRQISVGNGSIREGVWDLVFLFDKQKNHVLNEWRSPIWDVSSQSVSEYLIGLGCFEARSCESGYGEVGKTAFIFATKEIEEKNQLLVVVKNIPQEFLEKSRAVAIASEEYANLSALSVPIKSGYILSLTLVTLLIIFSAIWFGLYLSKELTVPIQALADATKRISAGDYDVKIEAKSEDEIGILVRSFNRMAKELKTSKESLELANQELNIRNQELERQKQYMEFVLGNIGAGVMSTDKEGIVSTFNTACEKILKINSQNVIGRHYSQVLPEEIQEMLDICLKKRDEMRKQIKFFGNGQAMNLFVSVNAMKDVSGVPIGVVAVVEDLTEVERAERMEAWQEVARRIAHEVKNPLTPIQLSAQRLDKKLSPVLGKEHRLILKDCTQLILSQVEELTRLVSEFSLFARLPKSVKVEMDLVGLVKEVYGVFLERHKNVEWQLETVEGPLMVRGDKEQLRRAITNILNNAVEAVSGKGRVWLRVKKAEDKAVVSILDDGPGIKAEYRHKVFEPYFSTKPQGGGLGLAIAHSIVKEHHGDILPNSGPTGGTEMIILLPLEP